MINRIKSLISVKNLTASQFADLLGVQRSNISHLLSGRNKPSLDFVLKIMDHFPNLSMLWLMKGQGEMFAIQDISTTKPELEKIIEKDTKGGELKLELNIPEIAEEISVPIKEKLENESEGAQAKQVASEAKEESAGEIEQVMILYKDGRFKVYNNKN